MTDPDPLDVRYQRALDAEKRRHAATKRLLNETEAALLEADNALAAARAEVERHGPCECITAGPDVEGPDEFCPKHGRPYHEVRDMAAKEITRLGAERKAIVEKIAVAIETGARTKSAREFTYLDAASIAREVGKA